MLNTAAAEDAVFDILTDQATRLDNPVLARRVLARELVQAVADLIRSGTVTASTTVTTTGSATTQAGPVNITNGQIS